MATGYTADVGDGKLTDFRAFAFRCARAFGALILMRDDPMDAPIPDEFKPSTHAQEQAEWYDAEVRRLSALTQEQIAAECAAEARRINTMQDESEARSRATVDRYKTMLAAVEVWEPPTKDHAGLKKFMRDQLMESIKHDGLSEHWPTVVADPAEWQEGRKAEAARMLANYRKYAAEEIERTAKRNEWVRALRESLPEPAAAP